MSLTTRIKLEVVATQTNALDIVSGQASIDYRKEFTWADGTGADQANRIFTDQRTLSASATEDLDLAGVLTDAFGATLTFAEVSAIIIYAATANTNNVLVGGAASAQFATWAGATNDVVVVRPGGLLVLVARDATAYAVTATSADLLKIANSAGSTDVVYDIIIVGRSA
jgi:hypothetical protein